ncbi:cation-transporting P-type ATPase [Planctomycetaceae bacterium SH139]
MSNEFMEQDFHGMTSEGVVALLESDDKHGLILPEVAKRQARFGPNALPAQQSQGLLLTLFLQFNQPLIYLLLAAVVVTAALGEWIDSGVILAVVLVNALIGFLQESKAAKALEALAKMSVTEARVLRDGELHHVQSAELVPGDIVVLQSGDKVPADMRLLHCRELQIDESALTGESVPVEKSSARLDAAEPLADRVNLAFSSTLVTYGQGRGIVFATGVHTEVGRIGELVSNADVLETPLTRKIASFSKLLLVVILVLAAVTFVVGVIRGQSAFDMFMAAVALAVGAIPEGLPAAVTITLAIGVKRMAGRQAVIRKLPAVETLGSTTTICSDKTGTLTVNQMTVNAVWAGRQHYTLTGTGYAHEGQVLDKAQQPVSRASKGGGAAENALQQCLMCGFLCNDSALLLREEQWEVEGDPTEAALIVSARKFGIDDDFQLSKYLRLDAIPFESQYQYMATLHAGVADDSRVIFVKGAVEVVLRKCHSMVDDKGRRIEIDEAQVLAQQEAMAASGLRVLAFAAGEMPVGAAEIGHADIDRLIFLGLQGMIDPPRPEAIEAVRACQEAGIRIKMITGDHPVTAGAIASKLGIDGLDSWESAQSVSVTGSQLAECNDDELSDLVDRVVVFARATPEQKLRLVRALQTRGHVVAMTGDGVNDAPALKQADIGVAMGVGGTEVAKEAADMVLTDDNFATIKAAVEEGRSVFDNLTKFIVWTLPTNAGEGLLILTAIFAGVTLPLLPVQILWINMTTAVLLGLMLAFEPKEPDIMQRPPRDPQVPLLTGALIVRIVIVALILLVGGFASFDWALGQGYSPAEARTVSVNVFVMVEMFYLFNCRSLTKSMFQIGLFTNRWIAVGVSSMICLQLAFTYLPIFNLWFSSAPIGWEAWGRILLTAFATYVVVGLEKSLRRRWVRRKH